MSSYRVLFLLMFLFAIPHLRADIVDLSFYECKKYSQNGEDGIISKIFNIIGATNRFYVEIGTETGEECNTRLLREQDWKGVLFDSYEIPTEFDLLSIDIDSNDFYVWYLLSSIYQPRVIVIEYNASHAPNEDKIMLYDPDFEWDGTNYFGASMLALYNLGRKKHYSLVYAENNGVNLFFVRADILDALEKQNLIFANRDNVEALYKKPRYGQGPNDGHWKDPKNRPYICSYDIFTPS